MRLAVLFDYGPPVVLINIFAMVLVGGGNQSAWRNPHCQVGTTNPTDMPDSSGQQLRLATLVLRPSRLTTWSACPVSEAGLTVQHSGGHPSKYQPAGCCFTSESKPMRCAISLHSQHENNREARQIMVANGWDGIAP